MRRNRSKRGLIFLLTYNVLICLSSGLGYFKAPLPYLPNVAGEIGDNLAVCNVTHSAIKSLEVMELEATMEDKAVTPPQKKQSFCQDFVRHLRDEILKFR